MSDKKANKNLGLCPTECRVDTWRSEELSDSPGCRKKFVFLWSNIHLNFLRKGQYTTYLSLKNCSTLSYRNTESSHRLPIGSSPGSLLHPAPICKPKKPFNYRRSPKVSGPLFSSQHSNSIFGFKIQCWTPY